MNDLVTVEHNPSPMKLDVEGWPIWSKEVSTFEWTYDSTEICYILEGEAIVTLREGESGPFLDPRLQLN